jgi:hypothetical protein
MSSAMVIVFLSVLCTRVLTREGLGACAPSPLRFVQDEYASP